MRAYALVRPRLYVCPKKASALNEGGSGFTLVPRLLLIFLTMTLAKVPLISMTRGKYAMASCEEEKENKTKIIKKSCYETRESRVVETRDAITSLTFFLLSLSICYENG